MAQLQGLPVRSAGRALQVADEGRGHSAPVHAGDVLQAGGARRSARRRRRLSLDVAARACRITSPPSRSSTASPSSARQAGARHVRDPGDIAAFPSCLVAEAVGQLAAWVAMSHIDFRGRPVAALANETRFHRRRQARATCSISRSRSTTATTKPSPTRGCGRRRRRAGRSSCRLPRPDAAGRRVRRSPDGDGASASRCCVDGGAPPGRFHGVRPPRDDRERRAGRVDRATLRRARAAPFFNDHFPRRPVFPATLHARRADRARACGGARDPWRDAAPCRCA